MADGEGLLSAVPTVLTGAVLIKGTELLLDKDKKKKKIKSMSLLDRVK